MSDREKRSCLHTILHNYRRDILRGCSSEAKLDCALGAILEQLTREK